MLVLGDSWAYFSWSNNSYNENLNRFGLSDKKAYSTATLSVNGTKASNFFTQSRIQELRTVLNDNPSIEYIHFSLGGNDILGTYNINNTPAQNQQDYQTLFTNIKAGIDTIHSIDSSLKILIAGYDYPNFEETIQNFVIPSQHPFYNKWTSMGQPTASQLNNILIEITDLFIDSTNVWNNVYFVNNLGLMQNTYGQSTPLTVAPGGTYPAGSLTVPNGLPNYPSPIACLNFGGVDSFHLNDEGYEHFIKRHFQEYYWESIRNADIIIKATDTMLNGTVNTSNYYNNTISVGENKGIITFNTSLINSSENIKKASIFIKRENLTGNSLITENIRLEIKSNHFGANSQIELDDYNDLADESSVVCTYGNLIENNDWLRIDIPTNLLQYIQTSGQTQFRLSYDNATGNNNFSFYNLGNNNDSPLLDITYGEVTSISKNIKYVTNVYPNPFNNIITIDTEKTIRKIKIIDVNGKVLLENSNKKTIKTNKIPKGVYILVATFEDNTSEIKKVIK